MISIPDGLNAQRSDTSQRMELQSKATMTVLLVDDNEVVLMTRRLIFERFGYRVLTAADGAGALSTLHSEQVQVAVVDYHLPDTNGDQLCITMKAQFPALHIILATGMVPDALSDCPDYVVVKGGSPMDLVDKVASLTKAA